MFSSNTALYVATLLGSATLLFIITFMYTFSTSLPIEVQEKPTVPRRVQHSNRQISVCAFANAQNLQQIKFTAAQWPKLPIWFVLWGQDAKDPEIAKQIVTLDARIQILDGKNTNHATGWSLAVAAAKKSGTRCEYFFSMDDDLTWSISSVGLDRYEKHATNTEVLLDYLEEYSPAVTVFPWPWGDKNLRGLQAMNKQYEGQLVQPATGFDNGCIVFHKGVIDFFVPFHLGKGFTPKFVTQHAFLNYFIPFMFRENAIRFNGLQFYNPSLQRHMYDNDALQRYKKYLTEHSKCGHKRWGSELLPSDVTWKVGYGKLNYTWNLMVNIASFYPITDTVIADHPRVRELHSLIDLQIMNEYAESLKSWCVW